jgi:diguanylate cyclase (GGDEF)-like protein
MANGRTERLDADERVERALSELQEVLADRADDPHARAALATLRDAFCVAHTRASLDPLTGLMNRASFDRALELAIAHAARAHSPAAVLFMDLDGFKTVNDQRGHAVGDLLLREVAARIMTSVREDDLLARYGGDEFVVLLEQLTDPHVVHAIASRVIEALSHPFSADGLTVRLSVSIGVALFPEHGASAEELLACADAAMYEAKRNGGDRYLIGAVRERKDDQSGAYARFDTSQRSTSAADVPLRRA